MGKEIFGDEIARSIANFIAKVGSDQRLPPERDMAEKIGVSRVALRDRLQSFEVLGLLERRQGSGTYVTGLEPAGLALMLEVLLSTSHVSLDDLHVIRIALERQSAILATALTDIDFADMERCIAVMETTTNRKKLIEADSVFHDHILRLAGNPALTFFADALHGVLRTSLTYRNQRWARLVPNQATLGKVHQDIVKAIKSGDPIRAVAAVDQHFSAFDNLTHQS